MIVILDMAISPNGLIARENGEEDWLPDAGWDEFVEAAKGFDNIVMGRETYDVVTRLYDDYNFDSVPVSLKIIVSRDPKFKAPKDYVVVQSPEAAVEVVAAKGHKELFLIGGGRLNSSFLKAGLVDEIHLTINPYIIGKGRSFIGPEDFEMPLQLIGTRVISGDRIAVNYKVGNSKDKT